MAVNGEQRWSRAPYPLQGASEGSARPSSVTSLPDGADRPSLDHSPKGAQRTYSPATWYQADSDDHEESAQLPHNGPSETSSIRSQDSKSRNATKENLTDYRSSESRQAPIPIQVYPDQIGGTKTLRRTSRNLRIDSPVHVTTVDEPPPQAMPEPQPQNAAAPSPWSRQPYPLQSTTSGLTAPQSPPMDPPDSPLSSTTALAESSRLSESGSEKADEPHSSKAQYNSQSMQGGKTHPRAKYPLQAPASNADLRAPSTPPPSERDDKAVNGIHQTQSSSQAATQSKPWGRQKYPLQAPASNANLRGSPTPPHSSSENETRDETAPTAHANQRKNTGATQSKPWARQKYPLQAPASNANLREALTPPPSPPPERESDYTSKTSGAQIREHDVAASSNMKLRRPKYPLQSPASGADLRAQQPLSSVIEDGSQASDLAAGGESYWRNKTYPLQPPSDSSPFHRLSTPKPKQGESEKDRKTSHVHLPKNIPAVKDAENYDREGRTIVMLLDGTGDKFDNDNSNIVHLVSALKKDDPRQVTYYQAGVGTYGEGGLSGGVTAALDMAVGSSLGLHVRDAYHFLMHSYKEGDKVCIFGFSRGAYTARCLAGMIHKVGLLPPRNIEQIQFAYEFYANDTAIGWKQSDDFKKTFCIDICVEFLGCFDSVSSVGFIPRQLPLSSTPSNKPRYFRHAIALDERRAKFKICRHQTIDWDEIRKDAAPTRATGLLAKTNLAHLLPHHSQNDAQPPHMQEKKVDYGDITEEEYKDLTSHEAPFDTDVLEVWFAGAHADIGGGAVPNVERHKLAHIPLRWMIRQCFECNTGIIFKTAILAEHGLDVHTLWPKYERLSIPTHGPPPSYLEKYDKGLPPRSTRTGKLVPIDRHENGEQFFRLHSHHDEDWTPEQVEDFYDAMSPLNDQLIQAPNWWILEFMPVEIKFPLAPGKAEFKTGMNLGRYRGIEDVDPNLHWTVLHRVQQTDYRILTRMAPNIKWRTVV